MGHDLSGVDRIEAARRLEVIAAGLRSGVLDFDDVHAQIPNRVQIRLTVNESAVEVMIAWRAGLIAEPPSAAELLKIDDRSPTLQAEARAAEEVRSADEAVVRDAHEGRMP
jgi:hypothetical protein